MSKNDFTNFSREDLVREIKKLKKRKKYGIVWDEEKAKEVFEKDAEGNLPVLKEIKNKEIKTSKNSPNILIEGDNFHALSVLNYTHNKTIDVIYIDPPYNTGIEGFRFNDKIVDSEDAYRHSKWLSYMSKRLKLAKNLLRNSGVIFISIDDNELAQLKLLCDEIFGENNFIANIIWKKRAGPPNDKIVGTTHEYILCYAKNIQLVKMFRKQRTEEQLSRYQNPDNHPKGPWASDNLMANVKGGRYVKSLYFPIVNPNTKEKFYPSSNGNWRFSQETIKKLLANNEIYFGKDGKGRPKLKRFLCDVREGIPFPTNWDNVAYNNTATAEIERFFGSVNVFDTPKPTALIKEILRLSTEKTAETTILDFFAGSGTTGDAVLQMNKEDGGKRKFILCTNNENNICTEICYPRLEKVMKGYKNGKGSKVAGLNGNLKYFRTSFVEGEPTDRNKKKLVDESTEMLCLKEDCFDEVTSTKFFKILKNQKGHYLGIVYDDDGIDPYKKEIKKIGKKANTYVFSLDESAREEEFEDVAQLVSLRPIPEVILNVYRRIFR